MKKVLLGSFVFAVLYYAFFYPTYPGIGIGILFLLFHVYLYSVKSEKPRYLALALACSSLSVFFAFCIGWRSNAVVQFLDILLVLTLTLFAGYFYKRETVFLPGFFSFGILPLSAFIESLASINNFFSEHKLKKPTRNHIDIYNGIFRGIIIALPILFILFLLLTGADPIFGKLAGSISISLSEQFIISIIIFIICFVWGITVIKDRAEIIRINSLIQIPVSNLIIESIIVTFGISLLFAVFLIVQLRFLFLQVPETELHSLGIIVRTYSEYVRQGFFQLLVASAISSSVIVAVLRYLHSVVQKQQLYLKLGLLILTLETQFLLITAGKRLFLYEQAHGLTRSRVFGIVFLVWLMLVLILLFVSVLKRMKQTAFFAMLSFITLGAFVTINIVPIDYIIAKLYPPTINNQIDYFYLSRLSPEVSSQWPVWINNIESSWKEISIKEHPSDVENAKISEIQMALFSLNDNIYMLDRKYTIDPKQYIPIYNADIFQDRHITDMKGKWQVYNMSEYRAYQQMRKNKQLFSEIKTVLEEIDMKQKIWYQAQGAK